MAQDFERDLQRNVGKSPVTLRTANSDDACIGIRVANVTASTVKVSVYITNGGNDYYLQKTTSIPSESALELIDGGSKIILMNGDVLKAVSDTASSLDIVSSFVDTISE